MEFNNILFEVKDHIAIVTLNRPQKLNAVTAESYAELERVADMVAKDDDIRVLLLRGQGDNFSSGFDVGTDLKKGEEPIYHRWDRLQEELQSYKKLFHLPKPTVSAVDGYCLGAGFELALISDFVIAADTARFGTPQIRHCMMPLVRTIWSFNTVSQAKASLMLGERYDAYKAQEMGLVYKVVPQADFEKEYMLLAKKLSRLPKETMRMIKQLCNKTMELQGYDTIDHWGMDMCALSMLMVPEERQKFNEVAERDGMRAALKWMNSYFDCKE
ncbi:MAG: enoyl-CoA hydratase/isomerase family protein [Christensenellaceae bacterium]|jgi:enoyl-CoA hydratase/carnithine racemase|nr:enoyl-CoA hydratase/isomerase family protein [Christensenellaceae bacterium]